jgi:hypothetical protein
LKKDIYIDFLFFSLFFLISLICSFFKTISHFCHPKCTYGVAIKQIKIKLNQPQDTCWNDIMLPMIDRQMIRWRER